MENKYYVYTSHKKSASLLSILVSIDVDTDVNYPYYSSEEIDEMSN